ncbi:MAG: hypothetical protein ONA90_03355, partial [candidate division KSB1 bacterium]|nr:hypothetical protein [candidate division KSB1 bacterium]
WRVAPSLFREGKGIGVAALLFLLGFSVYLYCPLAALSKPAINWDNPITWQNFFRLLTRADYGTFKLLSSEAQQAVTVSRLEQLPAFFAGLYQQFTGLGIGLALVGIFHFKRHKLFQGYLAFAFFFSGLFFVMFANMPIQNLLFLGVLHRFYLMPALFFSFWIGLGLNAFMQWLAQKKIPRSIKRLLPVILISGLLVWEFIANVEEADFRDNYMAENFARNILLSLPENSVFFVRGDVASMGVDYLQLVMGMRPDVVCLDQSKLTYPWYYQQAKERFPQLNLPGERYDGRQVLNRDLIANNINNFPICFMDFKEESFRQAFNAVPNGLVYRLLPKAQAYSPEALEQQFDRFYSKMVRTGLERDYPATTFEHEVKQIYAEPFFRLGYEFQQ